MSEYEVIVVMALLTAVWLPLVVLLALALGD